MTGRRTRRTLAASLAAVLTLTGATVDAAETRHGDPLAPVNRVVFRFNDALDRYLLEPVARGYDKVVPDRVEGWISNFFNNLFFPVTFTNCVLQAKPQAATQSLARFIINTTAGIGGFGDPASMLDVPAPNEDFGQTLGYWGVGPGPYLVLPLFGPSDLRDSVGMVADSATQAWVLWVPWWATGGGTSSVDPFVSRDGAPLWGYAARTALYAVNWRAMHRKDIEALRESSVDFYAAQRDAYLQHRAALVEDRIGAGGAKAATTNEDDLYFPKTDEDPDAR